MAIVLYRSKIVQTLISDKSQSELSLGLMPRMVEDCYNALHLLQCEGMTILLVEQNTSQALAVADDVCVLESGTVAWSGTAEQARQDSGIIDAYIGLRR